MTVIASDVQKFGCEKHFVLHLFAHKQNPVSFNFILLTLLRSFEFTYQSQIQENENDHIFLSLNIIFLYLLFNIQCLHEYRVTDVATVIYFSFFLGRMFEVCPHLRLRQLVARGCRRA